MDPIGDDPSDGGTGSAPSDGGIGNGGDNDNSMSCTTEDYEHCGEGSDFPEGMAACCMDGFCASCETACTDDSSYSPDCANFGSAAAHCCNGGCTSELMFCVLN
jgi:hypothetical protein